MKLHNAGTAWSHSCAAPVELAPATRARFLSSFSGAAVGSQAVRALLLRADCGALDCAGPAIMQLSEEWAPPQKPH